ncbi:MAG: GNAT family N-acetyltransferase [Treponema sp.]|nr:GNAT family N-acetyltransferase [Treponema sp.]
MKLNYTFSGFLYIKPEDDCIAIVDAMLATDYNEEFCIAQDFSPAFVKKLMEAGFLVMAADFPQKNEKSEYILLPKLHLERSALFFENLHIKKSIRRFLNSAVYGYMLYPNRDFERIVNRCIEKHGADWLVPPLVECIKKIRQKAGEGEEGLMLPAAEAFPSSFALYRNGKLVAGEFGVVCGNVYTSYSGYFDEDNAGTVQIILTARYLQEHGFSFLDFGMPMNYKTDLGAVDISPAEFVRLFRGQ